MTALGRLFSCLGQSASRRWLGAPPHHRPHKPVSFHNPHAQSQHKKSSDRKARTFFKNRFQSQSQLFGVPEGVDDPDAGAGLEAGAGLDAAAAAGAAGVIPAAAGTAAVSPLEVSAALPPLLFDLPS